VLGGVQWEAANQIYNKSEGQVYEILRSANQMIALGDAAYEAK